jgi:hypothetical protein
VSLGIDKGTSEKFFLPVLCQPIPIGKAAMIHALAPTGQLIVQTLGLMAVLLTLMLLVTVQFIETLQRNDRIFTPKLFYILFVICMALRAADLLLITHDVRSRGLDG